MYCLDGLNWGLHCNVRVYLYLSLDAEDFNLLICLQQSALGFLTRDILARQNISSVLSHNVALFFFVLVVEKKTMPECCLCKSFQKSSIQDHGNLFITLIR